VYPSIVTASVMAGKSAVGVIEWTPLPVPAPESAVDVTV
jgi:hypothetical protein